MSVTAAIQDAIAQKPGNFLFFSEDFEAAGQPAAIRKSLERLTARGAIRRVAQGVYTRPIQDPIFGEILPDLDAVAQALARRDRARLLPTGAMSMYMLGLSTQVPLNQVYLTDGASRVVQVEGRHIRFKRTSPRFLAMKGPISRLVVQALRSVGKDEVDDGMEKTIKDKLRMEEREHIIHDMNLAPAWIRAIMHKSVPDYGVL